MIESRLHGDERPAGRCGSDSCEASVRRVPDKASCEGLGRQQHGKALHGMRPAHRARGHRVRDRPCWPNRRKADHTAVRRSLSGYLAQGAGAPRRCLSSLQRAGTSRRARRKNRRAHPQGRYAARVSRWRPRRVLVDRAVTQRRPSVFTPSIGVSASLTLARFDVRSPLPMAQTPAPRGGPCKCAHILERCSSLLPFWL
jgi:hypothetical protein